MITSRFLLPAFAALGLALLPGCPDTEGKFNDFQDRYEVIHPTTSSASTSGSGGGCAAPAAGELDGPYVFALSASLDPPNPVLFDAQITSADGATGLELSFVLQALDAKDRMTKVGESFPLGPFVVAADGTFEADFPPLAVVGTANPISGSDLEADVSLSGTVCGASGVLCGALNGNVTKPTDIALDGSSFAFEPLDAPGSYPAQPTLNCNGDLAKPLGM